MLEYIAVF